MIIQPEIIAFILTKDEDNIRLALQLLKGKRKFRAFERYIGLKGEALIDLLKYECLHITCDGGAGSFEKDVPAAPFFKSVRVIVRSYVFPLQCFLTCTALERLCLIDANINSLAGLENCLNLKELHLPYRKVSPEEKARIQSILPNCKIFQLIKKTNGKYLLLINGIKCWEGVLKSKPGVVGIALNPNSFLFTEEFVVNARKLNGHITYGFHEALLNSGNYFSDWNIKTDSLFFYGQGAISKKDSCFAKWNFDGIGFELLLPKGPQYGTVFIYLDGTLVKKISLKNQRGIKSSIVFKSNPIKKGNHSVYIESLDGVLPVDCINIKL